MKGIVSAWGRILLGYRPSLSIEITRECPLRCPGCYAYGDEHLGGALTLREVRDLKGQALVDAVLEAVGRHRLPGGLRVGTIFNGSLAVGAGVRRLRGDGSGM